MMIKNIIENLLKDSDPSIKKAYLENEKYFFDLGQMIYKEVFKNHPKEEQEKIVAEMEKIVSTEQKINEEQEDNKNN